MRPTCDKAPRDFGGEVFQCSAQFYCPAVRTNIKCEKMAHALTCRTNVALLDTGAEAHHLMSEHFGESLSSFLVFFKRGQHFALGIDAHRRIGVCYRVTMILRGNNEASASVSPGPATCKTISRPERSTLAKRTRPVTTSHRPTVLSPSLNSGSPAFNL
jgi:hypothetical protein